MPKKRKTKRKTRITSNRSKGTILYDRNRLCRTTTNNRKRKQIYHSSSGLLYKMARSKSRKRSHRKRSFNLYTGRNNLQTWMSKRILSDRGSHFNNEMIRELTEKFKVKYGFSSSYHPKTNGLVERFNRTLCESLAKLKEDKEWDRLI